MDLLFLHIMITFARGIVGGRDPMIREHLIPPFPFNEDKIIERISKMKKKELKVLLREFEEVHGDKYDYKLVSDENYKNNRSRIPVICKEHDEVFPIIVYNHLIGQGCPICANVKRRLSNTGNYRKRTKKVYGIGINDYPYNVKKSGVHIPSYHVWEQMLKRCYSEGYVNKNTTYQGCKVCDDWLHFSKFKEWFDQNYVEGYQLDKDILSGKKNKIYSPNTCCFVPFEINVLLCRRNKSRGEYPIGVHLRKDRKNKRFESYVSINKKVKLIGFFDTPEEAFYAYKEAKEKHIQEVAQEYYDKGLITERVYKALMNYKVEITD